MHHLDAFTQRAERRVGKAEESTSSSAECVESSERVATLQKDNFRYAGVSHVQAPQQIEIERFAIMVHRQNDDLAILRCQDLEDDLHIELRRIQAEFGTSSQSTGEQLQLQWA